MLLADRVRPEGRWLMAEFLAEPVGGTFGATADPTGKIREVGWAGSGEVAELLGSGARAALDEVFRRRPGASRSVYREERQRARE